MPAVSQTQQRLMGMAWAYQKGELSLKGLPGPLKEKIKSLAGHMKKKDLSDFAHTTHEGLPEKITCIVDEILKESFKKITSNLEDEIIQKLLENLPNVKKENIVIDVDTQKIRIKFSNMRVNKQFIKSVASILKNFGYKAGDWIQQFNYLIMTFDK